MGSCFPERKPLLPSVPQALYALFGGPVRGLRMGREDKQETRVRQRIRALPLRILPMMGDHHRLSGPLRVTDSRGNGSKHQHKQVRPYRAFCVGGHVSLAIAGCEEQAYTEGHG